jgi:hypothetical protein
MFRVIYHPTDPNKNQYFLDGRPVSAHEFARLVPSRLDFSAAPGGHGSSCWPMASDAMMVHPSQAQEATANAREIGVPTEYLPDGRPVLTSAAHRKAFARAHHMIDRNGGYSDP